MSAAAASTALLLAAFGALGVPLLFLLAEIESVDPISGVMCLFHDWNCGSRCSSSSSWLSAPFAISLTGQSLRIIGANPAAATLFIVGSAGTIAGLTLDGAAIGLHRGAAQLWRGSLSALLKLACAGVLVLLSAGTSTGPSLRGRWPFCWRSSSVSRCSGWSDAGPEMEHWFSGERSCRQLASSRSSTTCSTSRSARSFYIVPLTATLLISPSDVAYSLRRIPSRLCDAGDPVPAGTLLDSPSARVTRAFFTATCGGRFQSALP